MYSIQGINCDDMAAKDLLMDIDHGEVDDIEVIDSPALGEFQVLKATPKDGRTTLDAPKVTRNGKK